MASPDLNIGYYTNSFMVCALTVGGFSMQDVNLFVMLNSGGGRCAVRSFAMVVKNEL